MLCYKGYLASAEEKEKNGGRKEEEGFLSPMYKTRSKHGIDMIGGDHSNVPKTIVNRGLDGGLGYCANAPMTISKSYFEVGVSTCAHKWKTSDTLKRKPSGSLHK